MSMNITTLENQGVRVVRVEGEVDVSNAAELRGAIDEALDGDPTSIEADIAGVSYIDSTGIGVLVGAAHRAEAQGASFSVLNPQRNVARVLSMLGVDKDLGVDLDA